MAERFVQLAVPGEDLLFASSTRRLGRSADLLIEGVVRQPAESVFRARAIVSGLDGTDAAMLASQLRTRYGMAVVQERARLAFDVRPADLPPGMFDLLLAFQASFGPAWLHFSRGRLTLRAQAVGGTEQECAARLRQALRLAGIRRQVRLVELSGDALAPWRELRSWHAHEEPVLVSAERAGTHQRQD